MSLALALAAVTAVVLLAPVLAHLMGRSAGWVLGAALVGCAGLVISLHTPGERIDQLVPWIPSADIALRLRLDGLSFLFSLVVLLIGAAVMVYSAGYLKEKKPVAFYTLMTFFAAAMMLLVLADDIVLLYVAWELTTLISYLLILRSAPDAAAPATRTLLITVLGGLCLLGAVALMWSATGTTVLSDALAHEVWAQDPVFAGWVAGLVAIAAMTKSAQFPFHFWLPDAMVAPAPVSAYLHAAAMVKAGIYLLMLFSTAASHSPVWMWMLITVGLITTVMGGIFALQKHDLKQLLAYSTVSQLGLLVVVIAIGTPLAMLAASVHVVAHALFKAAAFMHIGLLEKRFGSRNINDLSGLARSTPWDSAMIVLAAASMAGVIPLLGFVSKELVLESLLEGPIGWLLAGLVTLGAIFTVAYSAHIVLNTLPGRSTQEPKRAGTLPMVVAIGATALAGLGLGLTVGLGVLDPIVAPAAADAAGVARSEITYLALWHGINAPLLLSLTALVLGLAAAYWVWRNLETAARPLIRFSGVEITQQLITGTIASGRRVGDLTRSDAISRHIGIPAVGLGVGALLLPLTWQGLPPGETVQPFDYVLLGIVVLGLILAITARHRLTAVLSTGIVGFGVALWFYSLGAADVALTQLLVEILTVVIMVLVLNRLGRRFLTTPGRRRRILTAVISLGAGTAATLAALTLTGHRGLSPAGEYFLLNVYEDTGGTNVVNTILVDYRALDTFGELVVLAIAALSVFALIQARPLLDEPTPTLRLSSLVDPQDNAIFLTTTGKVLQPLMLFGSIYVLLRGHNAPGGGFIGALVGASALALAYLSSADDNARWMRLPYLAIAGSGIIVAVASGFLGYADGSFLRPLHAYLFGQHLTSALIFDVGVYLAVFGVILAALRMLGRAYPRVAPTADSVAEPPPPKDTPEEVTR
ncbi:hydrogen gas-evolving membrane-bound hydrogenase subunit E [Ornithinimicrobium sp. Y1694]|uniref:hydrogen gas-evolving membrane-bound hydrogenase subunit E n=1 Tax=Ornithinimicrobium sp. Y1694 TaxID=3418590 RepID=UPI003CFBADE3